MGNENESELQIMPAPGVQTPAQLLELAISKDLDIEKLERLMEMQERWEAKQAKVSFYDAITLFQASCPPILKTGQGHNSKFAPLPEISKTIKGALYDCGLSFRWEQDESEGFIKITCFVTHKLGHSENTYLKAEPDSSGNKNDIQARGSAVTYLQRYTLISALGLTTANIDDDGDSAGMHLYDRLLPHSQCVRENISSVFMIKTNIEINELNVAAECWFELSDDIKMLLWLAPTKGGIFTTGEREIIKSTEFRESHYGAKTTLSK